eukprot:scaffold46678_cov45-Phaeocystis_antarctica.AAC.1
MARCRSTWSKCPLPWQGPGSPPAPPHGAPGGSGRPLLPGGEDSPLGAQPPPRLPRASRLQGHLQGSS